MMSALFGQWSSVIPELPMVLPGAPVLATVLLGLLLLCVTGMWCMRERHDDLPTPFDVDDQHRLAA